jgi:hypothetical protein
MTEKSVWHIVKKSSKAIGLDKLAPHAISAAMPLGSAALREEN